MNIPSESLPSLESAGDMALIGEGTPNQQQVSFQLIQSIYNELTGKSEEVSKYIDQPIQVTIEDFQQLNHRVLQTCEQYNIRTETCSVHVYYINDTNDVFSSFGKFLQVNAASPSAVESVLVTYNFLILLPKTKTVQSYTLSVRIASRVSVEKRMRDEMSFDVPKVFRIMGSRTGAVTVKYIDYAVARSLLSAVEQWFDGLPVERRHKALRFIAQRSHYLPFIGRYCSGAVIALVVYALAPHFVPDGATPLQLARFLICAGIGLFAVYRLAHHLGRLAESYLDHWSPLSYIELTAADRKAVAAARDTNRFNLLASAGSFAASTLLGLLSKGVVAVGMSYLGAK